MKGIVVAHKYKNQLEKNVKGMDWSEPLFSSMEGIFKYNYEGENRYSASSEEMNASAEEVTAAAHSLSEMNKEMERSIQKLVGV